MHRLSNWVIERRDVETGHDFYIPHGNISPIVLSGYGRYYRVTGFWAAGKTILWLELWRTNTAGVVVNATLSPNELMGMESGLCDEIELHKLLNNQIVSEYFNEYPITEKEKGENHAWQFWTNDKRRSTAKSQRLLFSETRTERGINS